MVDMEDSMVVQLIQDAEVRDNIMDNYIQKRTATYRVDIPLKSAICSRAFRPPIPKKALGTLVYKLTERLNYVLRDALSI